MLTVTGGAPKELLRIAGLPAIGWVARECAESAIGEILVVLAPGKEAIIDSLAQLSESLHLPRATFVVQREPRGLADAIRLGRVFAKGEPLGVALPDNLFISATPAMEQVKETYIRTGKNVVGMVEIHADEASQRGPTAVYPGQLQDDDFVLTQVPDKGERGTRFDTRGAASAFTGIGRYVFDPGVFDLIDEVEQMLPGGAELDDIPIMQQLLARDQLVGRWIHGRFLDVGIPEGFWEAERTLG
jgi:UTP-glucose-1-phosphate uridylyltransferase